MESTILLILTFAFYMLPTIIAYMRKKRNTGAIAIVNFLLGWTGIAWVICLAWAFLHDRV